MNKKAEIEKIAQAVSVCQKCGLAKTRTKTVPGSGSPEAKIVFIGEGPGKNEDLQGLPFVGAAGKFLDELLNLIHLERKDIFITNVIKCRPPGNRDPEPKEVETCWPYLKKQLEILKPALIVNLGRHSAARFIPQIKISADHGQPKRRFIEELGASYVFYPIYHPAAALYQGSLRETLKKDFLKIPKILELIKNPPQKITAPTPTPLKDSQAQKRLI
jgi:DNA polymerase